VGRYYDVIPPGSFQDDLLDFSYARVNRRDLRKNCGDYARIEEYSTLLSKRIAVRLDPKALRMLEGLRAVQAVMMAMAGEMAYRRGMGDGIRCAAGGRHRPSKIQ